MATKFFLKVSLASLTLFYVFYRTEQVLVTILWIVIGFWLWGKRVATKEEGKERMYLLWCWIRGGIGIIYGIIRGVSLCLTKKSRSRYVGVHTHIFYTTTEKDKNATQ